MENSLRWGFEEALGSFLLLLMVGIAFINVIVRYCTSFSFAWSEELTISFFVWIVLLGTARAFRDGGHLGMSLLYESLPKKLRCACYWLSIGAGVAFFAALCVIGILEVKDEIQLDSISESLGIPTWWYTISIPLFSCLIILRMLQRAWQDLRSGTY